MKLSRRLLASLVCAPLFVPAIAHATSDAGGLDGPRSTFEPDCSPRNVLPARSDIPRWQGVLFVYEQYAHEAYRDDLSLARIASDGSETHVAADILPASPASTPDRGYMVHILEPLEGGATYALRHPRCSSPERYPADTVTTTFRALDGDSVAPGLAELVVSGVYAANEERGASRRRHFLTVDITVEPQLASWNDLLTLDVRRDETLVDRHPFVAGQRHTLRVDVFCRVGSHDFAVEARIPSTARTLARIASSQVFDCSSAPRVDWTTLEPLTPEEQGYWDEEPEPSPPPTPTPPPSPDAGRPDATGVIADARRDEHAYDCGCRTVGAFPSRGGLLGVVALAIALAFAAARRIRVRA